MNTFLKNSGINILKSGTTATVMLISKDNILYVAHIGDSRAILSRNGELITLTRDHNLE